MGYGIWDMEVRGEKSEVRNCYPESDRISILPRDLNHRCFDFAQHDNQGIRNKGGQR